MLDYAGVEELLEFNPVTLIPKGAVGTIENRERDLSDQEARGMLETVDASSMGRPIQIAVLYFRRGNDLTRRYRKVSFRCVDRERRGAQSPQCAGGVPNRRLVEEKAQLQRYDRDVRYSLCITLKVPDAQDIYPHIATSLAVPVATTVEV